MSVDVSLKVNDLLINNLDQLTCIARKYDREDPLNLVHEAYMNILKARPVFEYEGAFISYMSKAMRHVVVARKTRFSDDGGEEYLDQAPGSPLPEFTTLKSAIARILAYEGPLPISKSQKAFKHSESGEVGDVELKELGVTFTQSTLMKAFREGNLPLARRLIPIMREASLDVLLDEAFQPVQATPISQYLDLDLNVFFMKTLRQLPPELSYCEIQNELFEHASRWIPIRLGRKKLHLATDRFMDAIFSKTLTVISYLNSLEGKEMGRGKALLLHGYLGLSHRQVASRLGITERQARYLINTAMDQIRY